jgi:type I restriction enzyme S subunit
VSVELRPLGELCKTTSGGTPSRSKPHYFEGTIPWVKSGELPDGIVIENSEYISDEAISNSSAKLLPAGTLLVALYGATVGKLGILSRPAATNQAVCAIFPSEAIDTKFLFWYLLAKRPWLIGQAAGGAQPNISQGVVRSLMVPVMPLGAQHEIVAEIEKQFSRLDEAVANLQRVKANLKRYKASVLKDAVEGRLVPTEAELARREGRTFETGEQLLQRILEDRKASSKGKRVSVNLADLEGLAACPDGWIWTTSDAAIQSIDAGASFKCEERPPVEGEIGVLKVSALTWGFYDESESKTCKDADRIEEKFLVRDGDFLFSRANTIELVGASVIVGKTKKRLMLSDKTLRFDICQQVLPEWLQICLRCKFGRDEIERLATGNQVSMRNIGQERIRQIRIPLPPLAEQARIVAEVDRHLCIAREVEAEVDANLQRAQALRQSVLARSFQQQ